VSVAASEWDEGPSVLAAAWRYRWLLLVALMLGGLLGYTLAGLQPTLYEGVSRVFVSEPTSPTQNGPARAIDPARNVANQAEFMNSTPVLREASKRYGNGMDPDKLRRRLTVEASNESDVVTIRALDPTPAGAARLADAVALAYNDVLNQQSRRQDTAGLQQVKAEVARLRARLSRTVAALAVNPVDLSLIADRDAVSARLRNVIAQELQLGGENASRPSATVVLWESAEVPQQPAQPKRVRLAAVGAMLLLLGAVALAWRRTWRQQAIPTQAQPVLPSRRPPAGSGDTVEAVPNGMRRPSVRPPSPKTVPSAATEKATNPAAGTLDDRWAETPVLTPVAALARERENGGGSRSDDAEAPLVALTPESIANFEQLSWSIRQVTETLGDHRLSLFDKSLPQIEAEELAERFDLDLVAILVDDGEGWFKVVGDTGLTEAERQRTVASEDVQELLGPGPRRLQDAEQIQFWQAGGPGTQARTLVIAPFAHPTRFGMLVVGLRQRAEEDRPVLNDQEIEDIAVFARVITPSLAAWVLLRQLRLQLQGIE
jgi:capsular polysaccharide biosynthesis protein